MLIHTETPIETLQRSDIQKMDSGELAKLLGVIPEDKCSWDKLVYQSFHQRVNCAKMRDIYQSLQGTEIPAINSKALQSIMKKVLKFKLGKKYFPTTNIHENYYEILHRTLYTRHEYYRATSLKLTKR